MEKRHWTEVSVAYVSERELAGACLRLGITARYFQTEDKPIILEYDLD